jgi:hypothetical protein
LYFVRPTKYGFFQWGKLRGYTMTVIEQDELEMISGGISLWQFIVDTYDLHANGMLPNSGGAPAGGYGYAGDGVVPGDYGAGC